MAYNLYKIPLTNDPNQTFSITLPVNGVNRNLVISLNYNVFADYWTMCIKEKVTGKILIDSLPLTTGEYPSADLLGQFEYLGIGTAIIIKNGVTDSDYPNNTNLATQFTLVWGDRV